MIPPLQLEDNGVPVYVQIREQMLRAIGAGVLRPGEQMPTMRQIAVLLKVDLNTVRHAYSDLERTGAIVIVRAKGTYVADRPPPVDEDRYSKRVEEVAQQAIAMANVAGVAPIDVAQFILDVSKHSRVRRMRRTGIPAGDASE
jgi:GntR family transcriptional regulator